MLTEKSRSTRYPDSTVPRICGPASELPPTLVVLQGDYNLACEDALWDRLRRAIDSDAADLVLDLGEVTFLDASTITVFLRTRARLEGDGRRFSLRSLSPPAARIIEICSLGCLVQADSRMNNDS